MANRNILITDADRRRLGTLIERATNIGLVDRRYIDDLSHELERATAVDPDDVPNDVITMNSTVRVRDLDTGEVETYTLVYPAEADIEEKRISVLAPVGTAIIGYRVGDVIKWPVPSGFVRLRVEAIIYQPEHAGAMRG
ncbi:MAG: nucleoside diphosphate kinase regulator [Pirellulales bacterium]